MSVSTVYLVSALVLLAVSLALGRKVLAQHSFMLTGLQKLARLAAGLGAGAALFVAIGAFTFLKPPPEGGKEWTTDLRAGFKAAQEQSKPILVDAWAEWCASCLDLKKKTFSDPKVKEALADVVTVEIDMDAPENEWIWDEYEIRGLPWVAWFPPGETKKPDWLLAGFEPPEIFLKRIEGAASEQQDIASWLVGKGLLVTLLLVFLAGIGASLTPCAYPSYALILGFFGGTGAQGRRSLGATVLTAALIVLGMVASYSAAGVAAALGGGAVGKLMANPWVMAAIAVLFFGMGASSLGVLPQMEFAGLKTALMNNQKATPVWAFIFGLVMGLIVAPCVGPILFAILTYIAAEGDAALGLLLMVTFGLGMGVLFFAMALASQTVKGFLGKGRWNEMITVAFGIVFFAASLYYLKGLVP